MAGYHVRCIVCNIPVRIRTHVTVAGVRITDRVQGYLAEDGVPGDCLGIITPLNYGL